MKLVAACILSFWNGILPAQEPGLVLPVGHTSSVSSAVFSNDGKYIVTASWDNTAKIWQATDGRLLYELKGHSGSVTSAIFSADGRYIVTTSKDSTAKLWSSPDGKMLHEMKGHTNWVSGAAFSPNGKYIVTASWDHSAKLWETSSGRLVQTFAGHTDAVTSAAFSADNAYIITASRDNTAKLWRVAGGSLVFELKGHTDWVNGAVFSPDKKYIITASKDHTAIIWRIQDGYLLYKLQGHTGSVNAACFSRDGKYIATASGDSTAGIWQTGSGQMVRRIKGHTGSVNMIQFSPDGKLLVTSANDSTARIWRSNDGRMVSNLKGHTGPLNSAVFNRDGKFIVTASMDNTGRIWESNNGNFVAALKGHISLVTSAVFSQDGKYMATASWDNMARIWDATDGRLLSQLKGHTDVINSVVFSADGNSIATASSDNTARLWTVPDGKLIREFKGHTDLLNSAAFSPDGRYLVTSSWDQTARIWNIANGQLIYELKGHLSVVNSAVFSPDGKYIITASWDHTARVWNVKNGLPVVNLTGHTDKVRTAFFSNDENYIITASWDSSARIWSADGKLLHILKGHTGSVNAAIFSPDGKYVVTSAMDNTARIWQLADGALVHELKGHTQSVNWASYSPDGNYILTASWDNTARIWDAAEGKLLHVLKGHSSSLNSATYDAAGNFIVTTSEDNTIKKWDARTADCLYTFFSVDSTGYLAIDKDGHYDGTESARKMLYYVCGNDIVDLEQFKDLSWEPGLVSKLTGVSKEPITAKKLSEINICNYTPVVEEIGFINGAYKYQVTPRRGGIGEIELYVNNKLVEKFNPVSLPKKNNGYRLVVNQEKVSDYFVSDITNQVIVKATTREGMMLSRGASMPALNPKKTAANPNMYVISIGISRYKEEKISLRYASSDAMHFTSMIKASAKKLLNTDGREHVFTYLLNTDAGSPRWPAKSAIQKLIDTISYKATSDDILVIFFAGHGILQAGQKDLFLLTAEATGFELTGIAKEVAISTDELREWLRKIKANKQLLILDACNSGQAVGELQELVGKREVPADQQRALESLKDKTGTFILSASAPGQSAYETSLYGQGLLTYSLLAGVKLGTALKNNRFIDVTKWFNFACEYVKLQAKEIGARQDPQILGSASFEVGLVDKEITDSIQLPLKKKIFRRSRFIQDDELLNDDLDMGYLVDQELNNLSETGNLSPLVFVADNLLHDAYTIRGKYSVADNKVSCRISVFKGQGERIFQFDLAGTTDKKEAIAAIMVERVKSFLNKL
ncbi:MAG: caspase family protein [Ferruginibacter sp.]